MRAEGARWGACTWFCTNGGYGLPLSLGLTLDMESPCSLRGLQQILSWEKGKGAEFDFILVPLSNGGIFALV